MDNIKIISILFDYPPGHEPMFFSNLDENLLNSGAVTCLRFNSREVETQKEIQHLYGNDSLYVKFWHFKIVKLLEFLHTIDEEIILFLDALDTNIISPIEEIVSTFRAETKQVILGAETGLWPPTEYVHLYDSVDTEGGLKYLNSGTYIGYRKYIIKCLERIVENGIARVQDDQGAWSWIYLTDENVDIDRHMKLFFCTHLNQSQIYKNSIVRTDPAVLHDNGPQHQDTIKLNSIYANTCPMPQHLRGCLIPTKLKNLRQRPENWPQGSMGLHKLIMDVNDGFSGEMYDMLEIGSYFGESTFMFIKYGNIGTITCVDPFVNGYDLGDSSSTRLDLSEVEKVFKRNITDRFHIARHLKKSSLELIGDDVRDVDFVYLDGDHRLDHVEKEIAHIINTFSPKYIAGHDYNMVGHVVDKLLGNPDKTYADYSWLKQIRE